MQTYSLATRVIRLTILHAHVCAHMHLLACACMHAHVHLLACTYVCLCVCVYAATLGEQIDVISIYQVGD